jgi:hypothetical protein
MRFPSLRLVVSDATAAALRFPLVLSAAVVAAVAAILLTGGVEPNTRWAHLCVVGSLGVPLFFSLRLLAEREDPGGGVRRVALWVLIPALGVVGLVGLFYAWDRWSDPVAIRRYVQFSVGLHLLVAFLPWVRGTTNGFWQYNRVLFLRFLTAALFSAVLYLGLALALLALEQLFGLELEDDEYVWLWIIIAFLFNTWYFLGGIPRPLDRLEDEEEYPKVVRVFSQYILLPIVVLYLTILTAYLGKIVVTRAWPSGWIGYLVCCVSILGILSLLLLNPLRERPEQRWIRTYSRGFYVALTPAVAMLWLAIWKRIDQYGLTEDRYFLAVIAAWLTGMCAYFIFSRSRNIKVIPVTLCLLAVCTAFGPWGAYTLSRRSQVRRLEALFERHDLLVQGRVQHSTEPVAFEDRKQMSSILVYLIETHGSSSFSEWFGGDDALAATDTLAADSRNDRNTWQRAQQIMDSLGIQYVHEWDAPDSRHFNYMSRVAQRALRISDYDYVFRGMSLGQHDQGLSVLLEGQMYELRIDTARDQLQIRAGPGMWEDREIVADVSLQPLRTQLEAYRQARPPSLPYVDEPMQLEAENATSRVLVDFRSVSGRYEQDAVVIDHMQVDVYLRFLADVD